MHLSGASVLQPDVPQGTTVRSSRVRRLVKIWLYTDVPQGTTVGKGQMSLFDKCKLQCRPRSKFIGQSKLQVLHRRSRSLPQ